MTDKTTLVDEATLYDFAEALFVAAGFSLEEATYTAQSLVLSDLLGLHSHGVLRVPAYVYGLSKGHITAKHDLTIEKESDNTLHANGNQVLGQVQMRRLLDKLYTKAETQGVVSAAMHNSGHIGRVGEWVERATEKGFAIFISCNDNGFRTVAPVGGKEACFSTNPMAFGVPYGNAAFIIDISTSAVAMGKIRASYLAKEPCGEGLIQDHEGQPTTDPAVLFEEPKGTLLPMGGAQGYKGMALAMMVDCLVAGLSGGNAPPVEDHGETLNNVLVTLWNPEHFVGLNHMQAQIEKYLAFIKQSTPIDPEQPIRIPGDRSKSVKRDYQINGIPLNEGIVAHLRKTAQIVGVEVPDVLRA